MRTVQEFGLGSLAKWELSLGFEAEEFAELNCVLKGNVFLA